MFREIYEKRNTVIFCEHSNFVVETTVEKALVWNSSLHMYSSNRKIQFDNLALFFVFILITVSDKFIND